MLFSVIIENMLEKNENICYFDAHFHLADCIYDGIPLPWDDIDWAGCTCSHSQKEWDVTERFRNKFGMTRTPFGMTRTPFGMTDTRHAELVSASHNRLCLSFGLHPQSAGNININENAAFLEKLLQQNKLDAIGEAGFDYFTQEFKDHAATQEEMFNIQLSLALQYNLPLIVHARKANEKLFEYSRQLKKLPAVLFHSFMGPAREAQSLINHGINAYFSFGKQIMNNNKKVLDCVQNLPLQNLLLETDAPFQYLKGERFTHPADIKKIYEAFFAIRREPQDTIFNTLQQNFKKMLNIVT